MAFSNSLAAYPDIQRILDQAIAAPKGLRLTFKTEAEVVYNLGRLNQFRVIDRRRNAKIYPADHPLAQTSVYDQLSFRRKTYIIDEELHWCIDVLNLGADHFKVEEI